MAYFETLAELSARAGQTVAASDWVEITQQHIDLFAEATGDRQWICLLYTSPSPRDS